ncbi:MAG: 30S ribosome-binding factor RbfA [Chlamydiae bacterium]|nr:30S ribosome-binding factor RbfA [Chlamydiota bacterium]MBI3277906.1 30S ribosome-binding factor RbfA [Chlamydiota bacterium]
MKHRIPRVNELIRREISDMLQKDFYDAPNQMVTVTEVRTSKDLRNAKVFVSVYEVDSKKESIMSKIRKKALAIQRELGARIRLRYTPALHFELDETGEQVDHLDQIFKKLNM